MIFAVHAHICRIQRETESGRLVAVARVKVVRAGVHLVLEDAIRGSAGCIADNEHVPTGNIDPDGIDLVGGSLTRWPSHLTVCQDGKATIAGFGVQLRDSRDASTWQDRYTSQMLHVWVVP